MKTSDSIKNIAPALLLAQAEIGSAVKDSVNPFFKSKYADLGSVMEACKEALNKNGITVIQPVGSSEKGTTVETVLLHESGEFISDTMEVSVKQGNDPQAQGSAITYARRYSLQSMMFIPAEDDDAEKATNHNVQAPTTTARTVPNTNNTNATCPICHGPVWDNRLTKTSPKQPDFKCKDRSCGGVIWPPKNENVPHDAEGNELPVRQIDDEEKINISELPF